MLDIFRNNIVVLAVALLLADGAFALPDGACVRLAVIFDDDIALNLELVAGGLSANFDNNRFLTLVLHDRAVYVTVRSAADDVAGFLGDTGLIACCHAGCSTGCLKEMAQSIAGRNHLGLVYCIASVTLDVVSCCIGTGCSSHLLSGCHVVESMTQSITGCNCLGIRGALAGCSTASIVTLDVVGCCILTVCASCLMIQCGSFTEVMRLQCTLNINCLLVIVIIAVIALDVVFLQRIAGSCNCHHFGVEVLLIGMRLRIADGLGDRIALLSTFITRIKVDGCILAVSWALNIAVYFVTFVLVAGRSAHCNSLGISGALAGCSTVSIVTLDIVGCGLLAACRCCQGCGSGIAKIMLLQCIGNLNCLIGSMMLTSVALDVVFLQRITGSFLCQLFRIKAQLITVTQRCAMLLCHSFALL